MLLAESVNGAKSGEKSKHFCISLFWSSMLEKRVDRFFAESDKEPFSSSACSGNYKYVETIGSRVHLT